MEIIILIGLLFPIFFIGVWSLVLFLISKMGWARLAENFNVERSFYGIRIGIISAWINSGSYRNSIILKYNESGIYLEPTMLFRLFHPALFIPWNEIKAVREKKLFFIQYSELLIGNPLVATIRINAQVFQKFEPEFNAAK